MIGLFDEDLFANPVKQNMGGIIANKYIIPPFSILQTMSARWQIRKKQWMSCGLKSELGRSSHITYQIGDMDEFQKAEQIKKAKKKAALNTPGRGSLSNKTAWKDYQSKKYNKDLTEQQKKSLSAYSVIGDTVLDRNTGGITGTSIFDPVLTEIMYKWFCLKGGTVLDPFCGGSVRGLIALSMGLKYWGCDLRKEQVQANKEQISPFLSKTKTKGYVSIKISTKSLNQLFTPCEPDYITRVCKGRCCQGTNEIKVSIHKSEVKRIQKLGAKVKDNFILPDERGLCPFKTDEGLCSIHNEKPFGCKASPFTINKNNTLIVRNRYRLLNCYRKGENKKPAYLSHKQSLINIFGIKETQRIISKVKRNKEYVAKMPYDIYKIMIDNDFSKNKKEYNVLNPGGLTWKYGDSNEELANAPECDFILTCPPYGDLEIYSGDERDLSNMPHTDFIDTFQQIIGKACNKLKENRFACIVVSDFRDKKGIYRGFVADTIKIFESFGLGLYNELILSNSIGSLPVRIQAQFDSNKKVGRMHQNCLVFYKGDTKKIKKTFGMNKL